MKNQHIAPEWKQLIDAAEDGYLLVDTAGIVVVMNTASARIGQRFLAGNFAPGVSLVQPLSPERKKAVQHSLSSAFKGHQVSYEVCYPFESSSVWLQADYNPVRNEQEVITHVAVTIKDISEKKLLEASVKKQTLLFENSFKSSGVAMALVSASGNFLEVNAALCQLFDFTRHELQHKTFQDLTHPEDLTRDLWLLRQVLQNRREGYRMEKRYIDRNGRIIWAILTVSLVRDGDGAPDFFITQIDDITETKQLISALDNSRLDLQNTASALQEQVSQLQDFGHIVGHDLRTRASAIHLLVDSGGDIDVEELPEVFAMLKTSSASILDTLSMLMTMIRPGNNSEQSLLKPEADAIVKQLTASLPPGAANFKMNFSAAGVRYPKPYLYSLFYNLLSNAVKYRSNQKKLEVSLSAHATGDGKVVIEIKDNGIGIDLERYGNDIFKMHQTFHEGYDSKGIGLFITKNQLERSGGTISVKSAPGKGTTFTIMLPE